MSSSGDDLAELHRQNDARLQEIEATAKEQPLTSELQSLSLLPQVHDVTRTRRVRGDGNCYYRAFLYQLCERLLESDDTVAAQFLQWIKVDSWKQVLAADYEELMLEAFYDTIVELLEKVVHKKHTKETLHQELNEENGTSDYCTWYLRVVTATHLKSDPDRFLPFVTTPGLDMAQFCQREVEPMGQECEQVQVLALAEATGVQVTIDYLVQEQVTRHVFGPEDAKIRLHLLYRPGHYDILYP